MNEIEGALKAMLRAPIRTPADAERAARAADALADLLRAVEKARRALAKAPDPAPGASTGGLAGTTLHDAAAAVLEEAGTPPHAKGLDDQIKPRKKPRVALFTGPGGHAGRFIGESAEHVARDSARRSS